MSVVETPLERLRRNIKHRDGDTWGIANAFMEVWDKDSSGELTKTEFLLGLKQYGVLIGDMTEAEKKALWAEFDRSGDGTIDLHEFMMVLGEVYAKRQQLINEAFDRLDKLHMGEISVQDLRRTEDFHRFFRGVASKTNGMMSRLEFATYCSALSSTCNSDEEFQQRLERLTESEDQALAGWQYFTSGNGIRVAEWVSRQHANPHHVMGGFRPSPEGDGRGQFHVWCRPSKRSFIKGSWTYEFAREDRFDATNIFTREDKRAAPALVLGASPPPQAHPLDPTTTAFLGTDGTFGENVAAFVLKSRTRPKRTARFWPGRLRYCAAGSLQQAQDFLNSLQPNPANVITLVQWPIIHIYVNDVGKYGQTYQLGLLPEPPVDLIKSDAALVLGFTNTGQCLAAVVPPVQKLLRSKPKTALASPLKNMIRNPECHTLEIEGIYDSEDKLRELFERIDIDNSGFITASEFGLLFQVLEKFGVQREVQSSFVDNIMTRHSLLDKDKLSFQEFCLMMLKVAQW
eukprot:TRINITY_DN54036_c0_g1_i1.p1 TRINITY_DN54036_c0_g1~~TRINITY_DN54036_c0_g1_i1.p1  ORF type:complete len:515 (-),score=65.81 TRINITY_DN54036_c0_g1_i1:16-1560(-)